MIRMPGVSYHGTLPPLSQHELMLRDSLRRDIDILARVIGERNLASYQGLIAAVAFLTEGFEAAGYHVQYQDYVIGGQACSNLEVEVPGHDRADEIILIGAHYDSVRGCLGANDNATGVAAILALARRFATRRPTRTLRFVAFVNEEPPYFQTPAMGSMVYAQRSRTRQERIVAMLSLETMGYYADEPGIQVYPFPLNLFYPSQGNFIGFIGNLASRRLVRAAVRTFRRHTRFPSEGAALPAAVPGVGWSDQWAFWQQGYPGLMVTDTALYRYPYYHTAADTPDKIDDERLARVVGGLEHVIEELAGVN